MTDSLPEPIPPATRRLLLFARLPELGRVKTRLAAAIGDERALAVYEAMLRDLFAGLGTFENGTELEVMWAPSESANGESLIHAFGERNPAIQTGADLGDRLNMAFSERFFFHRTEKVVAIGVDEPRLGRDVIEHAFALLESVDWVVGPATDGGYYLIGCRAAAFQSSVFSGIEWGTASVLGATMSRIGANENTVAVLPERSDIDVVEDLRRFAAAPGDGELARLVRDWELP
ncbi:MAG: putative cytosolic protein [Acidobacteria bacterium]|nr:putative cytosolic protein [Acidobacteriota bacterium]